MGAGVSCNDLLCRAFVCLLASEVDAKRFIHRLSRGELSCNIRVQHDHVGTSGESLGVLAASAAFEFVLIAHRCVVRTLRLAHMTFARVESRDVR